MMKKGFGVLLIVVAFVGGALGVLLLRSGGTSKRQEHVVARPYLVIEGSPEPIFVSVADTDPKRTRGLSGAPGLGTNEGMLFLFDYPGKPAFWMKDMLFSIDIVWISKEWKVVDITEGLSPESYPDTVTPRADAQYVLELTAGTTQALSITIGQSITFKK